MPRILLVEPDLLLAKTYVAGLKAAGYKVTLAAGAQPAIMAADRHTPDLVILELQLVAHSGLEFLYEFRSYPEWQHIPVILHTMVPPAEFTDSWQTLQQELGVSAYLYKPQIKLKSLIEQAGLLIPVKT